MEPCMVSQSHPEASGGCHDVSGPDEVRFVKPSFVMTAGPKGLCVVVAAGESEGGGPAKCAALSGASR
jgi:hypothetical protein